MAREGLMVKVRRRLMGLAFIAVLFGLVALSIAVYNKAFTRTVSVSFAPPVTGNQLVPGSDVKVRGLIVGSVKTVKTKGEGTEIKLAIEPDKAKLIPRNSTAAILPKTLFGEQYVAIQLPSTPSGHIRSGDTIPTDNSLPMQKVQKALSDLLPLLQAVRPADLNATLTAVATALQGRGEQLGNTLSQLDSYLSALNPNVPKLIDDIDKLGKVAQEYNGVAPDILSTLTNLQTTSRTIVAQKVGLDQLLTSATDASNILQSFLAENGSRLITVASTSATTTSVLAEYAPSYQCVIQGMDLVRQRLVKGMSAGSIKLAASLYFVPGDTNKYTAKDKPKLVTGYGPNCFGLPNPQNPFVTPGKYRCLNDGTPLTTDPCGGGGSAAAAATQQAVGSDTESAVVNGLIAGTYGTAPDKVPAIATMLAAPALRGNEVTLTP